MDIEVIDKKAQIEEHKDDLTNYQRLVRDVANKIPDVKLKKNKDHYYLLSKNGKDIAKFFPIILGEGNALEGLIIDIYDIAIDVEFFKQCINTHLNNCKGLNKVIIQTYY